MQNINIIALGGQDEIGTNLYSVEINNSIFVFDVGAAKPPKQILGVNYTLADFSYLKTNQNKIKGIFITKISEYSSGGLNYISNQINCPIYSSEFSIFILNKLLSKKVKLISIHEKEVLKFNNIRIEAFRTSSCFPYSLGFAIHSDIGSIIYTGDYMFNNNDDLFYTDYKHLNEIAKKHQILLLMSDSSSAGRKGYTAPKHEAKKYIYPYIKSSSSRLILVCFTEDVYRIIEFLSMNDLKDKEIGIQDNILMDMFKFLLLNSDLPIKNSSQIKSIKDVKNIDNSIIIVSGNQENIYDNIIKIANGSSPYLEINKNDTVILSTPPTPGSELNYANVLDELARTLAKVISLQSSHVWNMNASSEDIKMMYQILKPKYFMPIRALYKDMSKANEAILESGIKTNALIMVDNGDQVSLSSNSFTIKRKAIKVGKEFANNNSNKQNDDMNSIVLDERKQLSTEGVLIIGVTIDKHTKLSVSTIDTQMRGVVYIKNFQTLSARIQTIVNDKLLAYNNIYKENKEYSLIDVRKDIRYSLYSFMRKEIGKTPIILTFLNEI